MQSILFFLNVSNEMKGKFKITIEIFVIELHNGSLYNYWGHGVLSPNSRRTGNLRNLLLFFLNWKSTGYHLFVTKIRLTIFEHKIKTELKF